MNAEHTRSNGGFEIIHRIRQLTGRKLLALFLILVVAVAVSVTLVQFIRSSSYRLLYAELSYHDMALVTSWLNTRNIGFRTKNNGKDIYIGADRIYQTRIDLSRDLISDSADTFPISSAHEINRFFSGSGINDNTAIQLELARTIASLEAVESARVRINYNNTAFIGSDSNKPHASIILKRAPSKTISNDLLTTITDLVSQSVVNLSPGDIYIYDSDGRLMSSGGSDDQNLQIPTHLLQYQQSLEDRLERRAKEVVDALIGPGHAIIKVSLTLDNAQSEATTERYDPNNTVVKKEHTEYAPGSSYTVPELTDQVQYIPPIPTTSSIDYEVNRTVNKTIVPAGSIKQMSVSILVTEKPEYPGKENASLPSPTAEILRSIESAVASVVSLQPGRGDTIRVVPIPLPKPDQDVFQTKTVTSIPWELIVPVVKIAMIIVGFGLLYMLLIRPLLKVIGATQDHEIPHELHPEPDSKPDTDLSPDEDEDLVTVLKNEILKNPTPTAHIIKNWLQET